MYKIFIRVTPKIYLRKFHVARSAKVYGLPLFKRKRKQAAAHLIIKAARSRAEKGFQQKLIAEFIDLYFKKPHTPSIELLRQLYETAENNRSNVRFLRFINSTK